MTLKKLFATIILFTIFIMPASTAGKQAPKKFGNQNKKVNYDFTKLNYNMTSALLFDMLVNQDKYLGKVMRFKGLFDYYETENERLYFALLFDATACCQIGVNFEDKTKKFPEDFPDTMEDVVVTGTYSVRILSDGSEYFYLDCGS